MSSSDPILSALTSLLPTHTPSTLPKPLINLATALLAQSRYAASSLKPEEEAARSCAIADLAVERLKTRLNLTKAPPRPPCGPRIYKKLFQYLDTALPAITPSSTPTKPQRTRDVFTTPTKPLRTPNKANPSTLDITRPPGGGLQFPQLSAANPAQTSEVLNDEGVPAWIGPAVRHVCKALNVSACTPHVYVGMASILKSNTAFADAGSPTKAKGTPRTGRSILDAAAAGRVAAETQNAVKLPALLISVLLVVVGRMYPGNAKVSVRSATQELVALGRVTSKRLKEIVMECERLEEDEGEKWTSMQWWDSVPEGNEEDDVEMMDIDVIDLSETPRKDARITLRGMANTSATSVPSQEAPQAAPQLAAPPPAAPPVANPSPSQPAVSTSEPTTAAPSRAPQASKSSRPSFRVPPPLAPTAPPRRTRPSSHRPDATDIKPTGLGTIDWLSPARVADYKKWEADILRRVTAIEKAEGKGKSPAKVVGMTGRKRKLDVLSSEG